MTEKASEKVRWVKVSMIFLTETLWLLIEDQFFSGKYLSQTWIRQSSTGVDSRFIGWYVPIGANLHRFCRFLNRIWAWGDLSHGELKFSLAYGQPCQSSSIIIGMRYWDTVTYFPVHKMNLLTVTWVNQVRVVQLSGLQDFLEYIKKELCVKLFICMVMW